MQNSWGTIERREENKMTVVCLHIKSAADTESFSVGYLIREDENQVTIAQIITMPDNKAFVEMAMPKEHITRRYDLPVEWW